MKKVFSCIPRDHKVVIIMDAAFGEDWLKEIEAYQWYWITRIRQGKKVKLTASDEWTNVQDIFPKITTKSRSYNDSKIMVNHNHPCRIVTKRNTIRNTKDKYRTQPRNYNSGNGDYRRGAKEPWILATNLPEEFNSVKIVNYYRHGLSGRYANTDCVNRWCVKMLLAAIVQIVLWIIGVVGHSQNFQRVFQANTVKNKKIFSYFFLGKLGAVDNSPHRPTCRGLSAASRRSCLILPLFNGHKSMRTYNKYIQPQKESYSQ